LHFSTNTSAPTLGIESQSNANAETVVNAMKRGAALHLQFVFGAATWLLSDGRRIDTTVAETVIRRPQIISVGDALFAQARAQTYRHVSPPEE
jgi:hypothetical protein